MKPVARAPLVNSSQVNVDVSRRMLLGAFATFGTGILTTRCGPACSAEVKTPTPSSEVSVPVTSISIAPVNEAAKQSMDQRDEAAAYKCQGGMFDCDGDRRDFAKRQWQEFIESGGVPKRVRDGTPGGPKAY